MYTIHSRPLNSLGHCICPVRVDLNIDVLNCASDQVTLVNYSSVDQISTFLRYVLININSFHHLKARNCVTQLEMNDKWKQTQHKDKSMVIINILTLTVRVWGASVTER